MLSGHCAQIDAIRILPIHSLSIALIISEAILDTDNDPELNLSEPGKPEESNEITHHKLVKTTPNPKATKKRSGELGPLPELPELPVAEGGGVGVVVVEIKLDVVADMLAKMQ